jgi:3-oxoacyl-[acyl-carrier protein] reductase
MDLGLRGRTALVCSSTAGLGRGTAEALVAEGARVVISGRRRELAEQIAAALPGAVAVPCDVTDRDAGTELAAAAQQALGAELDIVVLNGPGPKPASASEIDAADVRAAVETLLVFQQSLVAAVLPGMRERGWGRILAIGSGGVVEPIPSLALSNIGRAALAGYLKSLATEVAGDGVTVNMLLPGRMDTDRVRSLDATIAERERRDVAEMAAAAAASIPAGRYGTSAEFGAVAAFLCSQQAGYVTGTAVRCDGGAVRHL